MAQPIRTIEQVETSPAEQRAQAIGALLGSIADHSESLGTLVQLVERLHQRGVLKMAIALLEQEEEILQIVVDQVGKPGYAQGLKNAIALVQLFSSIDHKTLQRVSKSVQQLSKLTEHEPARIAGVLGLWRTLRDPDFAAGLGFMVEALKVLGKQFETGSQGGQGSPTEAGVKDGTGDVRG